MSIPFSFIQMPMFQLSGLFVKCSFLLDHCYQLFEFFCPLLERHGYVTLNPTSRLGYQTPANQDRKKSLRNFVCGLIIMLATWGCSSLKGFLYSVPSYLFRLRESEEQTSYMLSCAIFWHIYSTIVPLFIHSFCKETDNWHLTIK